MYAIVKTGGKQYRVQEGQWLLIERLPEPEGEIVSLKPLLYVNDGEVVDGEDIGRVSVDATILAHERGPKLRIVKFKPKRGYKRRTGHRQELTRIQVSSIKLSAGGSKSKSRKSEKTAEPVSAVAPVSAEPTEVSPDGA